MRKPSWPRKTSASERSRPEGAPGRADAAPILDEGFVDDALAAFADEIVRDLRIAAEAMPRDGPGKGRYLPP